MYMNMILKKGCVNPSLCNMQVALELYIGYKYVHTLYRAKVEVRGRSYTQNSLFKIFFSSPISFSRSVMRFWLASSFFRR